MQAVQFHVVDGVHTKCFQVDWLHENIFMATPLTLQPRPGAGALSLYIIYSSKNRAHNASQSVPPSSRSQRSFSNVIQSSSKRAATLKTLRYFPACWTDGGEQESPCGGHRAVGGASWWRKEAKSCCVFNAPGSKTQVERKELQMETMKCLRSHDQLTADEVSEICFDEGEKHLWVIVLIISLMLLL